MVGHHLSLIALGGACLGPWAQPVWGQGSFQAIGTLGTGSIAWGTSPDGVYVAGDSLWPGFYAETVRWDAERGMLSVTPGRNSSTGGAINWNGTTIAGSLLGNGTARGFRWTEQDGVEPLDDLPGGIERCGALGVSVRGDIIVGNGNSDNGTEAAYWTTGTGPVPLGDLPGGSFHSAALAISADGLVIVGVGRSEQGQEAMRWTASGGMVGLGDLAGGAFRSSARAVSADGSVIVGSGFEADGEKAFRWTEHTGMVRLDSLSNISTQRAYGVSWDGSVVVGFLDLEPGPSEPFYWTPEDGTRWLAEVLAEHLVDVPKGWRLEQAYGVSADGRTVVGWATKPDGSGEGYVAYLGPACRSDYDDDGSVNSADVIAYLADWAQESIFADWNYDGYIDTRDVIAFLQEWVSRPGCA